MTKQLIPKLYDALVKAGFPSPAEDLPSNHLDLNNHLVKHPASTFFVRVSGESMKDIGINDGDMLVVDKSLNAANDSVIVAILNGSFTVKRLKKYKGEIYLVPENKEFKPIKIKEGDDFEVWGVVCWMIKKL